MLKSIENIQSVPGVSTECVIDVNPRSLSGAYWQSGLSIFGLVERFDRRIFSAGAPDAFRFCRLPDELARGPRVAAEINDNAVGLSPDDQQKIVAASVDIIINFCSLDVGDTLLKASKLGCWELRFGSDSSACCDWTLVDAQIRQRRPVESSLVARRFGDSDLPVLYRSTSSLHEYSLFRSRNPIYWKSAEFPARVLQQVASSGWESILARVDRQPIPSGQETKRPGFSTSVRLALSTASRYLAYKRTPPKNRNSWALALGRTDDGARYGESVNCLTGHTVADPFLYSRNGDVRVFYEILKLGSARADIACSRIMDDGRLSAPRVVLSRPYHLSYPMIFDWQGGTYMIPETRKNKTVELYRADSFPDRWTLERVLFEGVNAVDTTIFVRGNTVWLFTCMAPDGASTRDELFLYSSDSPMGPWRPHPMNPVVSDVCTARPAGNLFEYAGSLYRPSQDNSTHYGYAVNLNRIDELSETGYRETRVRHITPDVFGNATATHTYNEVGDHFVFDIYRQSGGDISEKSLTGQGFERHMLDQVKSIFDLAQE